MPAKIPDTHLDLLTGPVYAVFSTIGPEGGPENTVVWCTSDGDYVYVNTAEGRRKLKNVRANPKVALLAIDTTQPYRWIDVRGEVEEITPDADYAHINSLAKLYMGVDEYYGGVAPASAKGTEQRVILKIRPDRVVAFAPPG